MTNLFANRSKPVDPKVLLSRYLRLTFFVPNMSVGTIGERFYFLEFLLQVLQPNDVNAFLQYHLHLYHIFLVRMFDGTRHTSSYNANGTAKTSQRQETLNILCSNQIAAKFLERGVDIDYKNPTGGSRLSLLASGNHFALIQSFVPTGLICYLLMLTYCIGWIMRQVRANKGLRIGYFGRYESSLIQRILLRALS